MLKILIGSVLALSVCSCFASGGGPAPTVLKAPTIEMPIAPHIGDTPQLIAAPAFVSPSIYYDARNKVPGVVLVTKVDTFKRLSLDLDILAGAQSVDTHYRSTVGLAGVELSHTWSLKRILLQLSGTLGVAATITNGSQPGAGVVAQVSWALG